MRFLFKNLCLKHWIILMFLGIFFLPKNTHAQLKDMTYTAGYYGNNVLNPGLKIGAEMLRNSETRTNKNQKTRTILNNYAADIGFYRDKGSHAGVFIQAGWQRKKIFDRLFITMAAKPLGVYRSFLPETYKVSEDGSINQVTLPGRLYFAPSASAGIGITGKKQTDRALFAKVHVMALLPYNTFIMPLLNVEIGYQFNLSK